MSHIFISYSHKDSEYAHSLAEALEQKGFSVWIDDRIDYGTQWPRVIQENIDDCFAFIVIMTPRAYQSDWVQNELSYAQSKGKQIFPLLLEGDGPWLSVASTQYVDVRGSRLPPPDFHHRLQNVLRTPGYAPSKQKRETQKPAAILQPRQDFEPEMILIPAGEFLMGSDPNIDKDARYAELPQHTVYLPDYYIAKTPVTNTQYAAFVQATGHSLPYHDEELAKPYNWTDHKPPTGKKDHPVVLVSWNDAVAYCNWLTEITARTYRLPTEAEWEKAARGPEGLIYPWGNEWDAKRYNTQGGKGGTTPVEGYPDGASPYGVLDMAGNVWEWCATKWQKSYPYDVQEDEWSASYLQDSGDRVMRGGSWLNSQVCARCAFRDWSLPNDCDWGFRLACHVTT